jgi:hypothetical protein
LYAGGDSAVETAIRRAVDEDSFRNKPRPTAAPDDDDEVSAADVRAALASTDPVVVVAREAFGAILGTTDEEVAAHYGIAEPTADPVPATIPMIASVTSAPTPSWSCPHCGHDQHDDDGDCLQCREPSAVLGANDDPLELPEGVSRGKGVMRANEALNCLMRIPKNDGLRKRGLQIVTDWISHNGGDVVAEPNQLRQLTYARIERIQEVVWDLRSYVSSPADQVQLGKVFEFCAVLATLAEQCLNFRKLDGQTNGRAARNK